MASFRVRLKDSQKKTPANLFYTCVISGFRRDVDEPCALLGHYAASSGNFLPTFPDKLSVQYSRVQEVQDVLKLWYEITTLCCVISQNRADLIAYLVG